jgi:hypothetical protein
MIGKPKPPQASAICKKEQTKDESRQQTEVTCHRKIHPYSVKEDKEYIDDRELRGKVRMVHHEKRPGHKKKDRPGYKPGK